MTSTTTPTVTLPFPRAERYNQTVRRAVARLVRGGRLSETGRGPAIAAVEDAFAALVNTRYALSFNSGTAALHAALHAVGAAPDAGVVMSPLTWISAITAALHAGSFPIFCDIAPDSLNLSPDTVSVAAGSCSAVLVTHTFGLPAPMDTLTRTSPVPVVEDCSHAHGAIYAGRPVGSWGAAGCFSLQESKAVSGGEGGILTTSDRRIYERALLLGHHPHRLADELTLPDLRPLSPTGAAHKFRMPALCAVVATADLRTLPRRMAAAQANLDVLHQALEHHQAPVVVPTVGPGCVRGWYGTPLTITTPVADPQPLFGRCVAAGIPLRQLYPDWLHTPLLRNPRLWQRFWPHIRAGQLTTASPEAFPNYYRARRQTLLVKIPQVPAAEYMAQVGAALAAVLTRSQRLPHSARSSSP